MADGKAANDPTPAWVEETFVAYCEEHRRWCWVMVLRPIHGGDMTTMHYELTPGKAKKEDGREKDK